MAAQRLAGHRDDAVGRPVVSADRERFLLLEALLAQPGESCPAVRMRQLLKYALRGLGLKCVEIQFPDAGPVQADAGEQLPDAAPAVEPAAVRPRSRRRRRGPPRQQELFPGT
jgi:hypothetical protein